MHDTKIISTFETSADDTLNISLREILMILKRNKEIIFGAIGFSFFLAIIFILLATPRYTAETVLQINVQKAKVVDIESVVSGITADEGQIQSQLDILNSRHLAGRVVERLHLVNDPEFSPNVGKVAFFSFIKNLFGINKQTDEEKQTREERIIKEKTITNLIGRLDITRNPKSYTLIVQFNSKDAEKSAVIANTFADSYLDEQLSTKFNATEKANDWINSKLSELQTKVRESELLVQAFREKNGLIETAGLTVTDQQLSELNTQLILARTERSQAEARLRATGGTETSTEVLSSPLIQNLRGQETEVLRKKSDLSSQYGPKHPKIINVNSELGDLRGKIQIEIEKVKSSLKSNVEVAKAREEALQKSLDELQNKSGTSTKARVELAQMVREMEANKSLYESFLARSKETSEARGIEQPDAFIISKAEPPVAPSYPKKPLIIIIAIILGVMVGITFAFIIEHLDNAFSSSKQIEEATGVNNIGLVPELEKGSNIIQHLVKRPSSVFSESLRSVYTAVHFSNPDHIPKTIMVTSSVPQEGKSSFSIAFATLLANSGKKVLLIDCDLKRPNVAKILKKEFEFGLHDLLAGDATEKQVLCHEEKALFDFIPAHPNTVNSHNLLSSNKMKELLEKMDKKYDIIILDTPPVMAISDSLVLSKIVDTSLFVVRWRKTPRDVVKSALKQLKSFDARLVGVVLARVDMEKQGKYTESDKGYYYSNYSEYYTG